jgi:phage tail sheath protein FI
MRKPTTPGVYVQELPSGFRRIEGVSTSTAAILGPVDGDPPPTLVTSPWEARALVGVPTPNGPYLPWAAQAFLLNGGHRLVIISTDFSETSLGAALDHLAGQDGISLLLAPDTVNRTVVRSETARQQIERRLVTHATERRDKLVLLALPQDVSRADHPAVAALPASDFAACWHPWLPAALAEKPRTVPPTGFIAGVIARSDTQRGAHKGPANEPVIGLAAGPLMPGFTTAQQAAFPTAGINLIRDFRPQGRGVRVWGARTRSGDPEWRYIAVRRLAIMVEQALSQGLRWVVFEPNDEPLWAQMRASAGDFLLGMWRGGLLVGDRPERAFFVRCDRTTMTNSDVAAGRVVILVGIAAVRPAEFVTIRLALATGDANA